MVKYNQLFFIIAIDSNIQINILRLFNKHPTDKIDGLACETKKSWYSHEWRGGLDSHCPASSGRL